MQTDATMFVAMPMSELLNLIESKITKAVEKYIATKAQEHEQEELLTIEEAGILLRVSKVTIHKWKKQRKIKSYRIGRRVYFKRNELIGAIK